MSRVFLVRNGSRCCGVAIPYAQEVTNAIKIITLSNIFALDSMTGLSLLILPLNLFDSFIA